MTVKSSILQVSAFKLVENLCCFKTSCVRVEWNNLHLKMNSSDSNRQSLAQITPSTNDLSLPLFSLSLSLTHSLTHIHIHIHTHSLSHYNTPSLYLSFSLCPPVHLFLTTSAPLSIYITFYVTRSIHPSLYLSISLCIYLSLYRYIYTYNPSIHFIPLALFLSLSLYIYIHITLCLSVLSISPLLLTISLSLSLSLNQSL